MDTSGEQEQRFTETRPARFIAVGNLINLSAASSEHSFSAELERIVGLAVPHLAQDRPNLVVLGEVLGLPLALTGKRGYLWPVSFSQYHHSPRLLFHILSRCSSFWPSALGESLSSRRPRCVQHRFLMGTRWQPHRHNR